MATKLWEFLSVRLAGVVVSVTDNATTADTATLVGLLGEFKKLIEGAYQAGRSVLAVYSLRSWPIGIVTISVLTSSFDNAPSTSAIGAIVDTLFRIHEHEGAAAAFESYGVSLLAALSVGSSLSAVKNPKDVQLRKDIAHALRQIEPPVDTNAGAALFVITLLAYAKRCFDERKVIWLAKGELRAVSRVVADRLNGEQKSELEKRINAYSAELKAKAAKFTAPPTPGSLVPTPQPPTPSSLKPVTLEELFKQHPDDGTVFIRLIVRSPPTGVVA